MTTDLDRLIEAVEAGEGNRNDGTLYRLFGDNWVHAWDVIDRGSLGAAVTLCEAMLPGWGWEINFAGRFNHAKVEEAGGGETACADNMPSPARALLLAVLRAKLMEMEDE